VESNGHQIDVSFVPPVVNQEESYVLGWSQEKIMSSQRPDETLGIVAAWLESQARFKWKETLSQDPELKV